MGSQFYFEAFVTLLTTCSEGQWVFKNTWIFFIFEINNLE